MRERRTRFDAATVGELAVAAAVVGLGALVLWETRGIRVSPAYSQVGPRNFPYIVGAGLLIVGIWLAIDVLLGHRAAPAADSEDADPTLPTDWGTLAPLAASLLVYVLLLEPAGFIIASTLLFVGAAFAMGSRLIVRDIAIGIILAVAVYVGFTEGLSLRLPEGVLEGILP